METLCFSVGGTSAMELHVGVPCRGIIEGSWGYNGDSVF